MDFSTLPVNNELISEAVEAGKFDNMIRLDNKYGEGNKATGDSSVKYFRKGKAESYKEELSPDLIGFINGKVRNTLIKYNLNYPI